MKEHFFLNNESFPEILQECILKSDINLDCIQNPVLKNVAVNMIQRNPNYRYTAQQILMELRSC